MVSSSWHDSSVPANHAPPPRGPSNCFKIFPSHSVALSPTLRPRKSFRCNTYELPRKCCKQKTYGGTKSFRCNTYKNTGEGSPTLQRGCFSKRALTLSPAPYPLCFHTLTHSPTQRHWHNSFPVNQLRTLFIATEGVPLSPHLGSRHSTPIVTLYVQRSFLPTSLPPYLLTSFHLGALRAPLATLFPPWLANVSANTSSQISTGAKRSRAPSAFPRIPRCRCHATISTAGSKSVRGTVR